jgi:hypothetical protein
VTLRHRLMALTAAIAAAVVVPHHPLRAAEVLSVCLDENIPLYSLHEKRESSGFFVLLSEAIAERLGRTLKIQWFETKLDPDDSRTLAANALLSDGRCALVGNYPLTRATLGKPGAPTARMPDFDGATAADRRRRVELGTLVPSRAVLYAPLTVVLAPGKDKAVKGLDDLDGLNLGIEASTFGDAILMLYRNGRYVDRVTHFLPGRDELLPRLERGEFEATLVDLRRFDAYRAEHPDSKIMPTGYYYRAGLNMGYVSLGGNAALIEQVNALIGDMIAKNEVAPLAAKVGLTYVAPRQPEITGEVTLRDLREE